MKLLASFSNTLLLENENIFKFLNVSTIIYALIKKQKQKRAAKFMNF